MQEISIFGFNFKTKFFDNFPLSIKKLWNSISEKPSVVNEKDYKRILEYLVLARVIILSILLGVSGWSLLVNSNNKENLYSIFLPIIFTYIISIINSIWLRYTKHVKEFSYMQLLLDVFLASLAIYITKSMGGLVLYLLSIIGASIIFHGFGAVIAASLSGLCYSIIASGILDNTNQIKDINTLDILSVYITLIVVSLLSAFISSKFKNLKDITSKQQKDIKELSIKQEQLFNDISDGIITCDLDSAITSINQAAKAILGLAELEPKELIGQDIKTICKDNGLKLSKKLDLNSKTKEEISLYYENSKSKKHLSYSITPIINSLGIETGKILKFNDLSKVHDIEQQLSLHEKMTALLSKDDNSISNIFTKSLDSVEIIGESKIILSVFSLIEKVSKSNASVLINGESGTGKELISRAIHIRSKRKDKPFVAVNCGAIPEDLIESEFFGHKKGSFTGAISDSIGLFRQANGGTLFLDEIGELPIHLQSKLLRAIQDRKVRAIGDTKEHLIDVRLITATNRDLRKEIKKGKFREDLFYRLNVVNITAPSLRDRTEDIPLLVRHFIGKHKDLNSVNPKVSPEALNALVNYPFPGNVRELENVIERALVLGENAILKEHLPSEIREYKSSVEESKKEIHNLDDKDSNPFPIDLEEHLAQIEKKYLLKALKETKGIKKEAATLLNLNFRSFRYRLKKYNL